MLSCSFRYWYLTDCYTEGAHKRDSIVVRPVRCAEPRHCNADDGFAAHIKIIAGFDRHEQGKGGVKTSGYANDKRFGLRMADTFYKTGGLYVEYVRTAGIKLSVIVGHKWLRPDETLKIILVPFIHTEADYFRVKGRSLGEAGIFSAVVDKKLRIYVSHYKRAVQ